MTAPAAARPADLQTSQELTANELEQARLFLSQTHNAVIGATKGLSEAQWNFKSAPDRWSIAENLDHIVTVQDRVLGPVLDQLAQAPPPPSGFDRRQVDSIVIHQFPTRLSKLQAPEFLRRSDRSPRELLSCLRKNHARFLERLESTPELRQHVLPAPPLKAVSQGAFEMMDGYQWILAASAHTERHVKQMLEVMADSAYPE
jgi:hypothetical protein